MPLRMEDDWYLTPEQTAAGEWYSWDPATATGHAAVAAAVAHFEAHAERNDLAAKKATEWLRQDALRENACVTRALVADGKVATFYGLASGEVTLTSSKKLERMGILGGTRVGSSHIDGSRVIGVPIRVPEGWRSSTLSTWRCMSPSSKATAR